MSTRRTITDGGTSRPSVCSAAATCPSERAASGDAGLRHGERHDESCRSGDEQVGATAVVADEGAASLASILRTTLPDSRVEMQAKIGPSTKRVILSVAHGGTVPEIDDVDTDGPVVEGLVHGIQAASMGGLL